MRFSKSIESVPLELFLVINIKNIIRDLLPFPIAFVTFGVIWGLRMALDYLKFPVLTESFRFLGDCQPLVDVIIFGFNTTLRNEVRGKLRRSGPQISVDLELA